MFGKSKRKLTDRSPQQESESARPRIEKSGKDMDIGMDYCERLSTIMDDVKVNPNNAWLPQLLNSPW